MRFSLGLLRLSLAVIAVATGCAGGSPSGLGATSTGGSTGGPATTVFTEDFAAFPGAPPVWTSTGTVALDNATGTALPSLNVAAGASATTVQTFNLPAAGATVIVSVAALPAVTTGAAEILLIDPANPNTVRASATVEDTGSSVTNYTIGATQSGSAFTSDNLFHEYRIVIRAAGAEWFRDGVSQNPNPGVGVPFPGANFRIMLTADQNGFRFDRIRVTNP